jgi:hypothetical protein
VSIDDSIKKWAGFLDQLGQIEKTLANVEKTLNETPSQLVNGNDIRNQVQILKSFFFLCHHRCNRLERFPIARSLCHV